MGPAAAAAGIQALVGADELVLVDVVGAGVGVLRFALVEERQRGVEEGRVFVGVVLGGVAGGGVEVVVVVVSVVEVAGHLVFDEVAEGHGVCR